MEIQCDYNRYKLLHWVLKVGNLKKSVEFFEKCLNLKVLRHEEFNQECEASCNGNYKNKWSKTMMGFGPEKDNFALELTYNYSVKHYEKGNDLKYISLQLNYSEVKNKAIELGYSYDDINQIITGPDSYCFKIEKQQQNNRNEKFISIVLRTDNLESSKDYWHNILQLKLLESDENMIRVGFNEEQVALEFEQSRDEQVLDFKQSNGRVAFACQSVQFIYQRIKEFNEKFLTDILVLPTQGKADVVVVILKDRMGYEICFVEDVAFYQLATPTYDQIDWKLRASLGADQI